MFESEIVGDRRHLTLTTEDGVIDRVVWGMITYNEIGRLVVPQMQTLDGRTVLRYDVSGLAPLTAMREQAGRRATVLALVDGLVETLIEAEKFMIGLESFVLTPEHVYLDPATFVPSVLCLPLRGRESDNFAATLREFLLHLWYDRADDREYVGELVAVLPPHGPVDLGLLSRTLRNLEVRRGDSAPVPRMGPPQNHVGPPAGGVPESHVHVVPAAVHGGYAAAHVEPGAGSNGAPHLDPGQTPAVVDHAGEKPMSLIYLLQHWTKENKDLYDQQRRARSAAAAGQVQAPTTGIAAGQVHPAAPGYEQAPGHAAVPVPMPVPMPGEATSAMPTHAHAGVAAVPGYGPGGLPVADPVAVPVQAADTPPVVRGRLRRGTTGEAILLDKPVLVLGRRRARVDIAIAGETVSKNHALLYLEGDAWALTDNGSTNGTEVDGVAVEPYVPVRLGPGSWIRIGDEVLTLEV